MYSRVLGAAHHMGSHMGTTTHASVALVDLMVSPSLISILLSRIPTYFAVPNSISMRFRRCRNNFSFRGTHISACDSRANELQPTNFCGRCTFRELVARFRDTYCRSDCHFLSIVTHFSPAWAPKHVSGVATTLIEPIVARFNVQRRSTTTSDPTHTELINVLL